MPFMKDGEGVTSNVQAQVQGLTIIGSYFQIKAHYFTSLSIWKSINTER